MSKYKLKNPKSKIKSSVGIITTESLTDDKVERLLKISPESAKLFTTNEEPKKEGSDKKEKPLEKDVKPLNKKSNVNKRKVSDKKE